MAKMTATEAARNFSDVLNRVAHGEEIEITRSGASVVLLSPVRARSISAERFRELMRSLPPVDGEFAHDLEEIRRSAGAPPAGPWPS